MQTWWDALNDKVCNRAQNGINTCQTSGSLFLAKGEHNFLPYCKNPDLALLTGALYQYLVKQIFPYSWKGLYKQTPTPSLLKQKMKLSFSVEALFFMLWNQLTVRLYLIASRIHIYVNMVTKI